MYSDYLCPNCSEYLIENQEQLTCPICLSTYVEKQDRIIEQLNFIGELSYEN